MKKLSYESVRAEFEARGFQLLSPEYTGWNQKLEYICPKGHQHRTLLGNFRKYPHVCPYCAGKPPITIDFLREQFESRGYQLLASEYQNKNQLLDFICPDGHQWSMPWDAFREGHGCQFCAGRGKRTHEDALNLFRSAGYTLLTPASEFQNVMQKLDVKCQRGHRYSPTFNDFRSGKRCRKCWEIDNPNRGDRHHKWKPHLADQDRLLNESRHGVPGYKPWRRKVLMRDKNTCQSCGIVKEKGLHVHHVEDFANNPELRSDVSNGLTLCAVCHLEFHKTYGFGNNSREQVEVFLKQRKATALAG